MVTDTVTAVQQDVRFTWTVYGRPTVTSPDNRSWTVGAAVSLQLATSCPNAPCSYDLKNGPATFGISSSGLLTGTVTSAAQTFTSVAVTVTDASAAAATSAFFTVTVNPPPSVASPATRPLPRGSGSA